MPNMITRLNQISASYNALFVDLWGCLHNGVRPYPEAVAALQEYRAQGGVVMLLTNAPRPRPAVVAHLDQLGVPHDTYDDITSSGDASRAGMAAGLAGMRVYHLGPEKDEAFFSDLDDGIDVSKIQRVPLEQAEGIVCTGLFNDATDTPEDYRATLLFAKNKGLKLLCTNPDIVVDYGDKRIYCAGAIAALYTEMGGKSLYFGKPHAPIYGLARNRLMALRDIADDRILCVGDGIQTDILGGMGDGLDTLFITGGLAADTLGNTPDQTALDRFFTSYEISPTHVITGLR